MSLACKQSHPRIWCVKIRQAVTNLDPDTRQLAMAQVFRELHRIAKPGGHVAFEVGEVHGGATKLEETVLPCGEQAGFKPLVVVINDQEFTKTANCWGVNNMAKGTNTNRIVVFRKD